MSTSVETPLSYGSKIEAKLNTANSLVQPLDQSIFKPAAEQLDLLRSTLHIDDVEVLKNHVLEVQKEAYEEFPYPCIRLFTYLSFFISTHPVYNEVLTAGKEKSDTMFLDIGCCMGADSRKLVFDGYPGKNVHATDLHSRYLILGHKLFNDKESCNITFFPADIFSFNPTPSVASTSPEAVDLFSAASPFDPYRGKATHIYTGLFFHLFDEPLQKEVARRLAILISPTAGSIIFGAHAGNEPAGPYVMPPDRIRFGHSPSSFTALWHTVFAEIKGEEFASEHVKVDAIIRDSAEMLKAANRLPVLVWSVKIV